MQQDAVSQFGNIFASIFPPHGAQSTVHQPFTHQWRSGTSSVHVASRDAAPSTVPHSYSQGLNWDLLCGGDLWYRAYIYIYI